MARDFNGTSDRVDWLPIANLQGSPLTISAQVKSDGWVTPTDYILCIHQSGNAATGIIFYHHTDTTRLGFQRAGTANLARDIQCPATLSGTWHSLILTHNGNFYDYTTIRCYFDGTETSYLIGGSSTGSSEIAPIGSWSIGGRIFDNNRNYDGKLDEIAVWNRVLNSSEIAALAAGNIATSPLISGSPVFYANLDGSSLLDSITLTTGIATGTSVYPDIVLHVPLTETGTGTDEVFSTGTVSIIIGSTCWGHVTGVLETNIRTFQSNWTGTGAVTGSGDAEKLELTAGQYMQSEVVNTGINTVTLLQNNYAAGDTVTLKYRHGATQVACEAASYSVYTVPFESLGYVQIRVESTL